MHEKLDRIGRIEGNGIAFVQIGDGNNQFLKPYAAKYDWRGVFIRVEGGAYETDEMFSFENERETANVVNNIEVAEKVSERHCCGERHRGPSEERSDKPFEHPAGAITWAFEHHVHTYERARRTRRITAENVVFVCGFLAAVTLKGSQLWRIESKRALDG